jgi:hypothetical protein
MNRRGAHSQNAPTELLADIADADANSGPGQAWMQLEHMTGCMRREQASRTVVGRGWTVGILLRIRRSGMHPREPGRARRVPVSRVAYGDSRTLTGQPTVHLTCAAAGPPVAATTFASRGSGVRVPLAPLPDSWYLARSEALSADSTLVGRVGPFGWLGEIWEIDFSLSPGVGGCWGVLRGVAGSADSWVSPRCGASSSSSSGTGECGWMAARSLRDSSHRAWRAAVRSSRIRCEA